MRNVGRSPWFVTDGSNPVLDGEETSRVKWVTSFSALE
jgi:hypothetical protein